MNKAELVNEIAKATGQTKLDVHNTVAAVLHHLTTSMAKGDRVTLVGFGTFERRQRQSRMGVNPQNPDQKLKFSDLKKELENYRKERWGREQEGSQNK